MRKFEKEQSNTKKIIFKILLFLVIITIFYVGINSTLKSNCLEEQSILENAVKKTIIQCYALEGMYPPNIEYLEKNYGLVIDHKKFAVHYEVFASNVMPNITVIALY